MPDAPWRPDAAARRPRGPARRCSTRSAPRSPPGVPLVGIAGARASTARSTPSTRRRPRTPSRCCPGTGACTSTTRSLAWAPIVARRAGPRHRLRLGRRHARGGAHRRPRGDGRRDRPQPRVRRGRARAPPRRCPCCTGAGDAQMMPSVPDRTFDCAVASMMLEQVDDLRAGAAPRSAACCAPAAASWPASPRSTGCGRSTRRSWAW